VVQLCVLEASSLLTGSDCLSLKNKFMPNPKEIYLLLYCRIGSKRLLSFDRTFFSRIEWLVDDIEYTSSDTGLIACIKSRIDVEMMHGQLMDHGNHSKPTKPVVLIDLKSGDAQGNLKAIKGKRIDYKDTDMFKFDPFIGERKGLEVSHSEIDSEDYFTDEVVMNTILDRISSKGIKAICSSEIITLDRYAAYLKSLK